MAFSNLDRRLYWQILSNYFFDVVTATFEIHHLICLQTICSVQTIVFFTPNFFLLISVEKNIVITFCFSSEAAAFKERLQSFLFDIKYQDKYYSSQKEDEF